MRYPIIGDRGSLVQETWDGNASDQIFSTAHLAASEDFLVVSAPFFAFGWKRRSAPKLEQISTSFEGVDDIDAHEGHVAVLGVRRGSDGRVAPEGGIGWIAPLVSKPSPPRAILRSVSGSGAHPMVNCPTFGVGGIRFLPNGSVVVIPGVEAGAFHVAASGKLLTTWSTELLGIGIDCSFEVEKGNLLSRDPDARWSYLNRFRTVDEILIVNGVPQLVVRRVESGETLWELIALEPLGKTSRRRLPIESPSKLAHIRGDVRDGRVVLLVFDEATFLSPRDPRTKSAEPSRLVVLETGAEARMAAAESKLQAPVVGRDKVIRSQQQARPEE
ncbi:MAG: hypothetical protein SX243_10895 [Acidobacteriota bacterium]|nr:hypothetical protein [Acidobacteriota bacterium]